MRSCHGDEDVAAETTVVRVGAFAARATPHGFYELSGTAIPIQIRILSDTHDNVDASERATDRLGPPVIQYFEEFELHGVLDNKAGIR